MKYKTSKIPKFKTHEGEARFWDTHSLTDYMDELKPAHLEFPRPKHLVSMRLEERQIRELKAIAREKGIGYLTLIRLWIAERLNRELHLLSRHAH